METRPIYGKTLQKVAIELPTNVKALLRNGTLTVYDLLELAINTLGAIVVKHDNNAAALEEWTKTLAEWSESMKADIDDWEDSAYAKLLGLVTDGSIADGSLPLSVLNAAALAKIVTSISLSLDGKIVYNTADGVSHEAGTFVGSDCNCGIEGFDSVNGVLTIGGKKWQLSEYIDADEPVYIYEDPILNNVYYPDSGINYNGDAIKPQSITFTQRYTIKHTNGQADESKTFEGSLTNLGGAKITYVVSNALNGARMVSNPSSDGAVMANKSNYASERKICDVGVVVERNGKQSNTISVPIKQSAASLSLSSYNLTAGSNGGTQKISATLLGNVTLNQAVTSSDESVATATASGDEITINVSENSASTARSCTLTVNTNVTGISKVINLSQSASTGEEYYYYGASNAAPSTILKTNGKKISGDSVIVSVNTTTADKKNVHWCAIKTSGNYEFSSIL